MEKQEQSRIINELFDAFEIEREKDLTRVPENVLHNHKLKISEHLASKLRINKKDKERISELLDNWQSSRTKSVKRFLLGITIVLTGSGLVNSDLSSLSPMGMTPPGENGIYLAIYLACIILSCLFLFETSYYIDKKKRDDKFSYLDQCIRDSHDAFKRIAELSVKNNHKIETIIDALDPQRIGPARDVNQRLPIIAQYHSVVSNAHSLDNFLHSIDRWVVRLLCGVSLAMLLPGWGIQVT